MSRVPYIRFFADEWLSGTHSLSLEEKGALITVVALIASTGERPKIDLQRLARQFGCSKSQAKKVLSCLDELGKVSIVDKRISNDRAEKEHKYSKEMSEKQSKRASNSRSKRSEKGNKNNDRPLAVARPRTSQPEPEPYIPPSPMQGGILFEDFYEAYPIDHRNWKNRAEQAWNELTDDEKQKAMIGVKTLSPNVTPAVFIRSRIFESVKPVEPIKVPDEGTDIRKLFDIIMAEDNGVMKWRGNFADGRVTVEGNIITAKNKRFRNSINNGFANLLKENGYEVAA